MSNPALPYLLSQLELPQPPEVRLDPTIGQDHEDMARMDQVSENDINHGSAQCVYAKQVCGAILLSV